jgi:hypothetical protein
MVVTHGVTQSHTFWFGGFVVLPSLKDQARRDATKCVMLLSAITYLLLRPVSPKRMMLQPGAVACKHAATSSN